LKTTENQDTQSKRQGCVTGLTLKTRSEQTTCLYRSGMITC